jgi:hypothetical protein
MKDAKDTSFINNNIRSITEDKNGMIWIASNEGIAEYNDRNKSFRKFGREEGLPTLYDCELMTDDHNRLWIGSGKGLFVLDSERLHFKSFSLKDGLNTLEFNEQSAFKAKSGNFIYPTLNGYTVFNPAGYKNAIAPVTTYISSFSVFNKEYQTATNTEDLKSLNLKHNENFFSIELTGLHFKDPSAISYSYKLEPVDKDWIYSKDRRANYTNLPGGAYQFKYKATADVSNWNVPEKMLVINIDTIFYKTIWFWTIVLLLAIIIIVYIYRLNRRRHETMFALQHKSQTLEKEKAIVQYENLKQQLNPHFLFNSLTSLRSLIRIDKQHAADFLDKMAISYRYILKSSEVEIVPLQEEIIFVQTYIELQRTRFGIGLQVSFDVDEKVLDKRIVPVTLQNLIENAIKHNRIDADDPLRISIYSSGDYIVLQNNLQIKEHVESSNKYGLKNLISLYKFLDNRPVIIENNGAIFSVKIPMI